MLPSPPIQTENAVSAAAQCISLDPSSRPSVHIPTVLNRPQFSVGLGLSLSRPHQSCSILAAFLGLTLTTDHRAVRQSRWLICARQRGENSAPSPPGVPKLPIRWHPPRRPRLRTTFSPTKMSRPVDVFWETLRMSSSNASLPSRLVAIDAGHLVTATRRSYLIPASSRARSPARQSREAESSMWRVHHYRVQQEHKSLTRRDPARLEYRPNQSQPHPHPHRDELSKLNFVRRWSRPRMSRCRHMEVCLLMQKIQCLPKSRQRVGATSNRLQVTPS